MSHRFGPRARQSIGISPWVSQWMRGSNIRSVQRGTITITGATSNTAAITAVTVARARLRLLGRSFTGSAVAGEDSLIRLELTNSTTVTAYVNTSPAADSAVASFEVVEYQPWAIKSVQRGTITNNATAAITAVNTAKSELDFLGNTAATAAVSDSAELCCRITLTNSTTVTQVVAIEATCVGGYQVIEWL